MTAEEEKTGLEPRWLPLEEAMTMFCRYADYAAEPMKLGAYRREFTALSAWNAQRRNEDALEREKRDPPRV